MAMNKAADEYDLKSLLDLLKTDILVSMNCHAIGTVTAFNSEKQSVQISINYKRTVNGVAKEYPAVVDCPIISLYGGTSGLTFPIAKGDVALILFNDRDFDNWWAYNQVTPPNTQRLHSFSDAIALVGLRAETSALAAYDTSRAVLFKGTTKVAVGTKIELSNGTDSLGALLSDLVTQVNSLVTQTALITVICAAPTSPSSPPVNAPAISAISAQLSTTAAKLAGLLQ